MTRDIILKKTIFLILFLSAQIVLSQPFEGMTLFSPIQAGGGGNFTTFLV